MELLKNLTSLAGILTALLYVQGNAFWYGYVSSMGLPVDLFQIGLEDTLIQGYIAATIIGLPYLLILFMYVVLFIAIAYNANEFSKFRWVKECVSFFSDKNTNKEAGHLLTEAALKHGMKGVLPLGLTIVFIGIALATLNKVSNHGNKVGVDKLESLAKPPPESVVYVNENQTIIGSVFLCSEIFCAIFSDNKITVVPVSTIEKIVSKVKNSPA